MGSCCLPSELTRSVTICEHVRSPVSQPNLCPLSRVILGGQCWQPGHEQLQRQHREPPAEERGHGFQNTRSVQLRLYTGIESHCWLLSTSYCSKIHNIVLYKELSTRRVIDLNETWNIYETIPSLNCELYKIIISLLAPPFKGDVICYICVCCIIKFIILLYPNYTSFLPEASAFSPLNVRKHRGGANIFW